MTVPSLFSVLLGGTLTPTPRLLSQVLGSQCIAADGGMAHAARLGLKPELWVGDFDSTSAQLEADYRHIARESYSADKDRTDGEIAIEAAIARGARQLVLVGGLGGQTDHALGHMALLLSLARRSITAFATSGAEEAYPLIGGELIVPLPAGSRLSIIALTALEGLDISGVRWPLDQASIAAGSTRTLSNAVHGPGIAGQTQVIARLTAGSGILVAYPLATTIDAAIEP